ERDRIAAVLPEAEILDYFDFGMKELRERGCSYAKAEREVAARVLAHLGITDAVVPSEFPVGLGDRLRADGIALMIDDERFDARRRSKRPRELEGIRSAARAAEKGMAAAAALLARAEPGDDGNLQLDDRALTAEQV